MPLKPHKNSTSIRILGTGSYVPPRVLSNYDLQQMGLETSDEWIVKRTGIVDQGLHFLKLIEAKYSFRVAVRYFIETIKEASEHNNIKVEEFAWFIPHQANLRMFQAIAKSLKIPIEKFYVTLDRYGNISSASCAISLNEAVRDGSIQPGQLICVPVFGGGLTWGSAVIRWYDSWPIRFCPINAYKWEGSQWLFT